MTKEERNALISTLTLGQRQAVHEIMLEAAHAAVKQAADLSVTLLDADLGVELMSPYRSCATFRCSTSLTRRNRLSSTCNSLAAFRIVFFLIAISLLR